MPEQKPIIVWFRGDLRIHDHPALAAAVETSRPIIPLFIFDDHLLTGDTASANRNRFLIECLEDLKASLKKIDGDLVIRNGEASQVLVDVVKESGATAVYYIADYTPYSTKRDKAVEDLLNKQGVECLSYGGKLAVSASLKLQTGSKSTYKVFTPFWKAWVGIKRAPIAKLPSHIQMANIKVGELPSITSVGNTQYLSDDVVKGGETEARKRLHRFLDGPINSYHTSNNDMADDSTSRLSPYLHFGCLSPREVETMLPDTDGARSWHRQLAWREFYYYVLFHYPHPEREFQERYRGMSWITSSKLLDAWKDGRTGYPVVDAAMRQLKAEGWMHNRARLIVGSFLTKDLNIDWREGEKHFMQWLLDGDMANNNGNWQWIASVGVDPAPFFRRLYNPMTQQERYDPDGEYVRRYVPELKNVPTDYISEPWKMPEDIQQESGCIIGEDYPMPVVDHKEARQLAMERYKSI